MFHIPAHKQMEHDQIEDYDQYYDLICLGMDPDEAKQEVIEALKVELIPLHE